MKENSIPPVDINNPQPVNEKGELLTTDNIRLMMDLVDLLFMGQEKDVIIPS